MRSLSLPATAHKYCCYNDDIQGTGGVTLTGLINALGASNIYMINVGSGPMTVNSTGTCVRSAW